MNSLQRPAATWVNLVNWMVSERSPAHTKKHILDDWLHLCKAPKQVKHNLVLDVYTMITSEGRVITRRGPKSASRALVTYWFLIQVLVTWVCLFCKNSSHCTLDLCVNLYIYYCNKNLRLKKGKAQCAWFKEVVVLWLQEWRKPNVSHIRWKQNTKIFTKHQQRLSLNNWIKGNFFFSVSSSSFQILFKESVLVLPSGPWRKAEYWKTLFCPQSIG